MPAIRRLPEEVFSRIAAGEVVERPASLLKELVENSLDAGATRVDVEITGAGRGSLRVADDGCGMDAEDVKACLERHATSKISVFEDLEKLSTFGFRGEALYAAAAVSKITVTSATRDSRLGWRVSAEGGKITGNGPAPAVAGTTVLARDLFFNTPARAEFLKSDGFERAKLAAVIEEAALANPGVRFTYKSEGRLLLRFEPESSGDAFQDLDLRAGAVLGDELAGGLLPIDVERPGLRARMLVSSLDTMPSSRGFQYFFVNRRPISSRLLQQALYKAYGDHRPQGRHPVCVALLELPPDGFDVNVHPGKREVRFKKEGELFEIISGLTGSALAKAKSAAPIILAPRETASVAADAPSEAAASRAPEIAPHYLGGRSFFPEEFKQLKLGPALALSAPEGAPAWYTPPFKFLGQIERSYLVFEAAGGLFVLDQHAAAERILFEKFLGEIEQGGAKSQKLMLPVPVDLPASAVRMVLEKAERLGRIGFEIAPFGRNGLHVTATPALFKAEDAKHLMHRVADALSDPVAEAEQIRHDAVAAIACKAAVKAHDRLGEEEAYKLLEELKDCKDGSCCPHGRRALLALNREELARRFQRPGAPPLG